MGVAALRDGRDIKAVESRVQKDRRTTLLPTLLPSLVQVGKPLPHVLCGKSALIATGTRMSLAVLCVRLVFTRVRCTPVTQGSFCLQI